MQKDEKIIRRLAEEYAGCAAEEINRERKRLHQAVVDLHMIRPVVLIDELPWSELNDCGELSLQCEDSYLRSVENYMRQMLYRYHHIPGDMILPSFLGVTKVIHSTGIGLDIREDVVSTDAANHIVSHRFVDQMEEEECLDLLHNAVVTYDEEETQRRYNLLAHMVGDIIPVKIVGNRWLFDTLWDDVAQLHGVENTLVDLILRPDYMHAIADKLTNIFLDKVRQYERLNLFEGEQDTVHCTTAYTKQLPGAGFDGIHYRAVDVWGIGSAQVFSSASPAQREEFEIPYMCRAMEPFGLVYYGCCEPLHNQIDIVAQIPHLRKISVTPWADFNVAAEKIGSRYVLGGKANPAMVAVSNPDEEYIRKELLDIRNACTRNNCSFEIVLKDVSTVAHRPENLKKWERIAMEVVRSL